MAAPTVYTWLDSGAPQIHCGNVSEYIALFQAVLIDGYGTKAPPGSGLNKWSIPFQDATSFVLKQGGTQSRKCCMKLYNFNSSGTYCNVTIATDFTDINAPVGVWGGGGQYDRLGVGSASNGSYGIPWVIFATERTIYCMFGYNNSSANITLLDSRNSSSAYICSWAFGDYVPEDPTLTVNQFVIYTYQSSSSQQYYCDALTDFASTGDSTKILAGIYGNVEGRTTFYYAYTRSNYEGSVDLGSSRNDDYVPSYPNMVNGGLYLDDIKIFAAKSVMGKMPGLLAPIQSKPFEPRGSYYVIDGTGDYAGSKIYVFNSYSGQFMLHDGDWGVE